MLTDEDMLIISAKERSRTIDEERSARSDAFDSPKVVKDFLRFRYEHWPAIELSWDVSKYSQRFSLDNIIEREFRDLYPEGFLLGCVSTEELDKVLPSSHSQPIDSLWSDGDDRKIAQLLAFLSTGSSVSPTVIAVNEMADHLLAIKGGTHRYAVAEKLGLTHVPIYIDPGERLEIDSLVAVVWRNR